MGNHDHTALIILQRALKPGDSFGVKVVGRLIKQQHVRLGQQQTAERYPAALTTGEFGNRPVTGRATQGIHGDLGLALQVPGIGSINFFLQLGLTLDQRIHLVIIGDLTELHRDFIELLDQFNQFTHAIKHVFGDGLLLVQFRFL